MGILESVEVPLPVPGPLERFNAVDCLRGRYRHKGPIRGMIVVYVVGVDHKWAFFMIMIYNDKK